LGGQHEYALDETSEKKSSLAYGADEFTAIHQVFPDIF
jgi:hypothetical protein